MTIKKHRLREFIRNKFAKLNCCCPHCWLNFSDWFIWDGSRYCWPCWYRSGHTLVIKEDDL